MSCAFVHSDVADLFLPAVGAALLERGVEIVGDAAANGWLKREQLWGIYPTENIQ